MQIADCLERDDRIVLPVGSPDHHGSLSLGPDALLAERVSVEAAEPLGVPVLPVLPFGMAPDFTRYPGTMSLRIGTYIAVLRDLLDCIASQGFRRIAVVNGHGGNAPVAGLIREWISEPRAERVQGLVHSGHNAQKTSETASRFDEDQYHGSWLENFPWTRVAGVDIPDGAAPVLPRELVNNLTADEMRQTFPDGSLGGAYRRSDEDMQAVWDAGVAEVRELL